MPRARDDLVQARQLRDDLRALKAQYPELTSPEAQDRLTTYMSTQIDDIGIHRETKEAYMPAKGDRTLGEDLATLTFKVPASALPVIEAHLREMQRQSRWQRIGRSDALRDIFLRGIDSIENPTQQFPVVLDAPQLPLPSARADVAAHALAALAAVGEPDMPPAPAAAYEARAMDPEVSPEVPLTIEHPLELDLDVTQESVVPEAPIEAVRPQPARPRARRQPMPPEAAELEEMPLAPAQAVTTTRPKAAAKPKRKTTRTTKGR